LKLRFAARAALLTLSALFSVAFCPGQGTSQTNPSGSAQSTQSPATASSGQDKPADQPPSAQSSSQDPITPVPPDNAQPSSAKPDTAKPDKVQPDKPQPEKAHQDSQEDKKKDDRMFYVMPNYLTVDNQSQVKPISWKEKFAISAKGSFDPYEFTVVGIVAGIRQAENSSPGFGQGLKGYAKRYGAAFADQVDGNVMVGGVYPSLLKVDPRYFQLGKGSFLRRMGYAFDRIFVAQKDSGSHMFNVPEFAGNATAIAISNFYYPAADRSFTTSISDWGTQMGIDAFGNELKEFWPDIHHYLQRRHARHLEREQEKQEKQQEKQQDRQQEQQQQASE
jgi:hypothetical protein